VASKPKEDYTWDVYTTLLVPVEREVYNFEEWSRGDVVQNKLAFGAVGFTTGLMAVDLNNTDLFKGGRERAFPLELIEKGIQFRCMTAKASMPDDEQRIKAEIEHGSDELDATLHGVVAAAALERALKDKEDTSRGGRFLEAVKLGKVRSVSVSLEDSDDGRDETLVRLFDALAGNNVLASLTLVSSSLTALPEGAANWTQLSTLNLDGCSSLTALPEGAANWTQLSTLNLQGCSSLTALPEGAAKWTQLSTMDLYDCPSLTTNVANWTQLSALDLVKELVK